MRGFGTGDLYLARLVGRRPYRWTLYAVFSLTALASLYLRVGMGRSDQVLPWYGLALSLYGLGMALASRDRRCRLAYGCFGLLVAAAFSRRPLAAYARAVGVLEVVCCLVLLWAVSSLSRDGRFVREEGVLKSGAPGSRGALDTGENRDP